MVPRNSKRGFTLIEIAIALLILGVGFVGILSLFPVGFEATSRANNLTVATMLAQGILESAKLAGYDNVDGMATAKKTFDAPYDSFEYSLQVTGNVDGYALKQVDVEVYWPAGTANQKSTLLTTYIADYGP